MKPKEINRREFLKLLGAMSISFAKWPRFELPRKRSSEEGLPNFLIVLFDSLSARNMSLHGYPRQTMPNLERIAEKAIVFHRHYAGGNFTTSGTASLLTGCYPWSHRGFNTLGLVADDYSQRSLFRLQTTGYNTFAYSHNPLANNLLLQFRQDITQWTRASELSLVSNSYADRFFHKDFNAAYNGELVVFRSGSNPNSSFFISRFERLKRYFAEVSVNQSYKDLFPRGVPNHWSETQPSYIFFTLEQSIDWIRVQLMEQPRPFLGYIHLFPPHYPYMTRHDFIDIFDDGWQPVSKPERYFSEGHPREFLLQERQYYDEFIAYVDAEFGRLYEFMEQSGLLDNTYLIFTSDHGEMFERGIYTHNTPTLYEPVIHIPLLIWAPGEDQRQNVFTLTSCVDVFPTLLHLTGQPVPSWCEGQILPPFALQSKEVRRNIFAVEARRNPRHAPLEHVTLVLMNGRHKLVHYLGYGRDVYELFDLEDDPEELVNLYPTQLSTARELREELAEKLAEVNRIYR